MLKNLLVSSLIFLIGVNINQFIQTQTIVSFLTDCDNIVIVNDNNYLNLDNNDIEVIKDGLFEMCKNSYEMPAFGVSLHEETTNAIKEGIWIILKYDMVQFYNEMPFDELLINVKSDSSGFNIIRGNNGKFDGRCYYLSLNNNMSNLYNTIISIINKKDH